MTNIYKQLTDYRMTNDLYRTDYDLWVYINNFQKLVRKCNSISLHTLNNK